MIVIEIISRYSHKTMYLENKLNEDISFWSYLSYKLYSLIPFIFEMNTLLEWSITRTVLEMKKWFTVEEIHRLLYQALYDVIEYFFINV